jgi:hypothetical protein
MKTGALTLFMLILLASGCSSRLKAYEKETAQFVVTADEVIGDLNRIDTVIAHQLFESSSEVAARFRQRITDTLSLDFAYRLDSFLAARKQLGKIAALKDDLYDRAVAAKKRCTDLHADIVNGAGERSDYAQFVQSERTEIRYLRTQSKVLLQTFETAKTVIAQFQPEIERFISRFAQPVTSS